MSKHKFPKKWNVEMQTVEKTHFVVEKTDLTTLRF